MISKVTLFSLLLMLLLAAGIEHWNVTHRDNCARYFAGEKGFPPREMVVTGTRQVEIPCTVWLPRQPATIQILCLLDLTLGMIFFLNALADLRRSLEARRQRRV